LSWKTKNRIFKEGKEKIGAENNLSFLPKSGPYRLRFHQPARETAPAPQPQGRQKKMPGPSQATLNPLQGFGDSEAEAGKQKPSPGKRSGVW
jgi:hypothetical protein